MDKAVEALGLNAPQLIAQVASFFVLRVILRLTLYKPILKMLDERKQKIAEGLNKIAFEASMQSDTDKYIKMVESLQEELNDWK